MKLNRVLALKLILLFALLNVLMFIGFHFTGVLRVIEALFLNLSGLLLVIFFFKLRSTMDMNLYFKIVFTLLIIWSLYVALQDISFVNIQPIFGHYIMGWAWLTPLAVVFGSKISNWLKIYKFISIILVIGIIMMIVAYVIRLETSVFFGIIMCFQLMPFIFLGYFYQKKVIKYIIIISFLAFILTSIIISQRVNIIYISLLIIFLAIEFLRQKNINRYKKIFLVILFSLVTLFSVVEFESMISKFASNKELTVDTRTFLFIELFEDMSQQELWTGRGALGKYYSPYFESWNKYNEGGDSADRSVAEVGYLEMILKGGYIMIILYLLILFPAAYLGIFKSNNIIGRMCGYIILIYLILWMVSYIPIYSSEFILLWMAVGTAISSSARNVQNSDILVKRKGRLEFAKQ